LHIGLLTNHCPQPAVSRAPTGGACAPECQSIDTEAERGTRHAEPVQNFFGSAHGSYLRLLGQSVAKGEAGNAMLPIPAWIVSPD